jgi:hypothetical protein
MIEINRSDCKYVWNFTRRVGSIHVGVPSRRTVFVRGTNAKQREVLNNAARNTMTKFSKKEVQDLRPR